MRRKFIKAIDEWCECYNKEKNKQKWSEDLNKDNNEMKAKMRKQREASSPTGKMWILLLGEEVYAKRKRKMKE